MVDAPKPVADEIEEYLHSQDSVGLLRVVTCGSVDDGKSTLIGRMLYESHLVLEDQLAALERESAQAGTQSGALDLALLVDGLSAEREQGITIDIAHRFFATGKRRFIVADAPGHEQYTRNLVTAASNAELAILLVDARKGLLTQTRRHSYLVSMLGVRNIVLAVNKIDLVDYSQEIFERIKQEYLEFAQRIGLAGIMCVPTSALGGDNVVNRSPHTPWYQGSTLMRHLETVSVGAMTAAQGPFRMPVQWVNRPNSEFRGLSGPVVGGVVRPGDRVRVLPSGPESQIARIVTWDGDLAEAVAGQSVTVTLADELDVSRGDLLCAADMPTDVADQFEAKVVWMGDDRLLPGRLYRVKIGTKTVDATVTRLKYKINVDTLERAAATTLELNEIGVCNLQIDRPIAFDPYDANHDTGGMIFIDRVTNATVGAGLLHFALNRSRNLHWQTVDVNKVARAELKGQRPCIVWFTGLSGAGKSTIANRVEKRLHALGKHTYLLDGDNVRKGLTRDLGFTDAARVENIRRVAEVAKLMVDAGLIVLAAFISPFRIERDMARTIVDDSEFLEVFVDAPLAVAEHRDPKGLYRQARRGALVNFTGIDSPYEPPEDPDIHIDTTSHGPDTAADMVMDRLRSGGWLR
jgi:bifunctional enzyme CysN/CysC